MIETITLQQNRRFIQTSVTTNSHKIIKIPHHFETARLFIKDVLPTGLIRREIHFFASLLATGYVGPVNNFMEKGVNGFPCIECSG